MKLKHTLLLLLLALPMVSLSQSGPYGNEWINFSQTYFRFKVKEDGLYRISYSSLTSMGMPSSVTGAQFQLWRDGKQVAIQPSSNSAMLATDYIDFIGRGADGTLDAELFKEPQYHGNNRISLYSDSSAYYLTWNALPIPGSLRYTEAANTIPGTPPAPLSWCWNTVTKSWSAEGTFIYGPTHVSPYNGHPWPAFYSSQYEPGEGFANAIYAFDATPRSVTLLTPNAFTAAGVNATLSSGVLNQNFGNDHFMKVAVNNNVVATPNWQGIKSLLINAPVPAILLNPTSGNSIVFTPQAPLPISYDRFGIAFAEMKYPRNFDLNGINYFRHSLPGSGTAQYLEYLQVPGGQARLYDLTNNTWYEGNLAVAGKVRFSLPASLSERDVVLVSNAAEIALTPERKINFTNYNNAANQGNYIILTHNRLMQPLGGINYIDAYADYRRSAAGGSYSVVIADVDALYDQFAYGYLNHPLALKHFLKYGYDKWATLPDYAFLIGRGVLYNQRKEIESNPNLYGFPIVPTFGYPGSDIDLVNFDGIDKAKIRIGRLPALNAGEIVPYFNKIKAQEAALAPAPFPTTATEWWKKQELHVVGGAQESEQLDLLATMNHGKEIIEEVFAGRQVSTVLKNVTTIVNPNSSNLATNLLNSGISQFTFHGHASSGGFEYDVNNPETYNNAPRVPLLLGLGCDISQIFATSTVGVGTAKPISERYVFAPNGGSIATLAASNTGYTNFHRLYLLDIYGSMANSNYGGTLGRHFQAAYDSVMLVNNDSTFMFAHLESMLFIGDPAARAPFATKPDYYVGEEGLTSFPAAITTELDSFKIKITAYNLAKATHDTVVVKIEHVNPDGARTTVMDYKLNQLYSTDTAEITIAIDKIKDLGLNKYIVTLDPLNTISENSEINNSATLSVFIYSDNLVPIYPRNFGIVYKPSPTLRASTLNAFRSVGKYLMELDTTELFNSAQLEQTVINGIGGIISWKPNAILRDSTVYYWRAAVAPVGSGPVVWSNSSFIYLANSSEGWSQSHYFQYLKDGRDVMTLGSNRVFNFEKENNILTVKNILARNGPEGDQSQYIFNGTLKQRIGQYFLGSIQIMVIDSASAEIWPNNTTNTHGALPPNGNSNLPSNTRGYWVREFPWYDTSYRMSAARMLDSLPNGTFIAIKNSIYTPLDNSINFNITNLLADTLIYGHDQSLYHAIKRLGFNEIDSFTTRKAFVFIRRKGDASMPVYQKFNNGVPGEDPIVANYVVPGRSTRGSLLSKTVGPALDWTSLHWRFSSSDAHPETDSGRIRIYGIPKVGTEVELYDGYTADTSLAFIDASVYPQLRMEWLGIDSIRRSSPQLDYWRVLYQPYPEAALNPALAFSFTDSVEVGQNIALKVAVQNLTTVPMDSMLVRYKVIDAAGVTHDIGSKRYSPMRNEGDSIIASISFDPISYPGNNFLYIEANPDADQPEQYHPNNLGYLPFTVKVDKTNPLLDVTFDGVHILDGDIVSSKPFIKVRLKDENNFRALDDTGLLQLRLQKPGNGSSSANTIPFDGVVCRFIPGKAGESGTRNEAFIEFKPELLEDGRYKLLVHGTDKSGNKAGATATDYEISFEIVNKPSITQILNYPNPFSTSTAFLFTLTGSQIPSQLKIQILTVTGKVVREITKQELGPLHIGRNITEYKWDGKDQYGQLLGNGVYLYRVVSSLNGKTMDAFTQPTDASGRKNDPIGDGAGGAVDRFFKNGYGKMYIMR